MYDFISNFLGKRANLKKSAHDLSNNEAVSLPFGTEVPIKHYFTVPNEFYNGHVGGMVQTAPMREDNFTTINQELRAVYVPMSSLMRDYLSITSSERSTRKDPLVPQGCNVLFGLQALLDCMFAIYFWNRLAQALETVPNIGKFRFSTYDDGGVDKLGWNYTEDNVTHTLHGIDDEDVKAFVSITEDGHGATGLNQTIADFYEALACYRSPLSNHLICFDVLRLLDNLEFGNYMPLFDYVYTVVMQAQDYQYYEINMSSSTINLIYNQELIDNFPDKNLSLLPLLAYQYYINICRRSNYRNPYSFVITCDAIQNARLIDGLAPFKMSYSNSDIDTYIFMPMSGMWAISSDAFSNAASTLMDCMVGQDSLSHLGFEGFLFYIFSLSNPLLESDLFTSSQLSVVESNIPGASAAGLTSNPVQTINDVEALYSLRQDLLRAGIRRDKQMEAIFGVSGNQHVYEPVKILDVASYSINNTPVIAQAETEEMALGERGARGNGKSAVDFKLKSEDFGFIFITAVFTTPVVYEAFGINRQHLLSPRSWFNPKNNHLGLEPVRVQNLSVLGQDGFTIEDFPIRRDLDDAMGFSSHDWHLKTQVDKAHGLFTNYGFASAGGQDEYGHLNSHYIASHMRGNAIFGGFLPTVITQQVHALASVEDLYYRPDMVNNIFIQMVDGVVHDDLSYDYFRCAYHYGIHKVSIMPKIGLLNLNV